MSETSFLEYLVMFVEKPIDYDDFLNADPAECSEKFFANAKGQKSSLWVYIIFKWFLTAWLIFGFPLFALPLTYADHYNTFIDEQDYYFMCAMGQPGFSEELYDGDWVYQKLYLKQIARDLYRNPTPLFYTRTLFKLMDVFKAMSEGAV